MRKLARHLAALLLPAHREFHLVSTAQPPWREAPPKPLAGTMADRCPALIVLTGRRSGQAAA
jgi:hypothetical protein